MASKKFDVQIDVDSGEVKIAADRVLTLKEELRILEKFKSTPGLTAQQFGTLSNKINDTKDKLESTNARSREFFNTLSLIPGPIGNIAGKIDGTISLMKILTNFKLTDIKGQFLGLINDIKGIGKSIMDVTGATKIFNSMVNTLTGSFVKLGVAETTAARGAKLFATALSGIGFFLFISLATQAIEKLTEFFDATKRAKEEAEFQKFITEENAYWYDQDTKNKINANKKKIADLRASGASEKTIREQEIENQKDLFNRLASERDRYYAEEAAANKAGDYQRVSDLSGFYRKYMEAAEDAYSELLIMQSNHTAATNKEQKDANAKTQQELDANNKKIQDAIKQANQIEIELRREKDVLELEEGINRNLKQLENQKKADADRIRALGLSKKREQELLDLLDQNYQLKKKELESEFLKETQKLYLDHQNNLYNIILSTYSNNTALQEEYLGKQLELQKQNYIKEIEEFNKRNKDIQVSTEEQQKFLTALEVQNINKIEQIRRENRQKELENTTYETNLRKSLAESSLNDVITNLQNEINAYEKRGKAVGKVFDEESFQIERVSGERSKNIMTFQKNLLDFRFIYKILLDEIKTYYDELDKKTIESADNEIAELKKKQSAFKEDSEQYKTYAELITKAEQDKTKKINELLNERLSANQQVTTQIQALDRLEIDSKRAVVDKTIETFGQISNVINSIQGVYDAAYENSQRRLDKQLKNEEKGTEEYNKILQQKYDNEQKYLKRVKAMQIAAALFDAGVSIARIIVDTQRAIIAFKASVAPLGPAGAAMATAYSAQSRIQQALSIGIITTQAIAKIMNISGQQGSVEAPDTSPGGARGMEKGGVIKGRRHAQGGTLIEAEDGEAIMNRNSTAMFLPLLSAMNQMGGGTSFANDFMTLPDKPMVSSPSQDNNLFIKTYVVEQDITTAQYKHARLKELTTL